jgi:hypothetical protein
MCLNGIVMLLRPAHHHAPPAAMPHLSAGEWRGVQAALRAVAGHGCTAGEMPGPLHRGLRRIGRIVPGLRARLPGAVAPELEPLRDFLCESARHGPAVGELAEQLERQGYSPAQIAALSFIAG